MADNKDLRNGLDRNRVAGNEEYELNYITKKMGVSRQEVLDAIANVGNDRAKIEEYLKGRK